MLKRAFTAIFAAILVVLTLGSVAVFGEESANPIPQLNVQLKPDGTSSITFTVTVPEGDASSLIDYYSQSLTKDGYTVEAGEDAATMVVKKDFPVEDGYLIDFTLYGIGKVSFVEFKDFFTTKYGIKNSAFNSENQPAGETYMKLTVDTPSRVISSNATTRTNNGKTNNWDIVSGSKNELYMTFKTYNIIPLISTLFAVLVLLVLLYIAYTSRKKKPAMLESEAPVVLDAEEETPSDEEYDDELENPIEEMEFDEEDSQETNEDNDNLSDEAAEKNTDNE